MAGQRTFGPSQKSGQIFGWFESDLEPPENLILLLITYYYYLIAKMLLCVALLFEFEAMDVDACERNCNYPYLKIEVSCVVIKKDE